MPDVRDSFKNVAANYSKSTFHTSSARLQEVLDLMRPKPGDLALDVATGTGNTAFALAPYVRRVVGLDLTREMLNEARRIAAEKEFKNTDWVIGDAEHLPFQDDTFDIDASSGEARTQLHPEWREGKLWHAYWHALIRAHKPGT